METIRPNALIILKKDDFLLVQKGRDETKKEVFCRLLGGGIEFGESSKQTLFREIKEELGATLINESFLGVIENIFDFNNKKYHELTFLYEGKLSEENIYKKEKVPIIDKVDKYAEWISISDIKSKKIILYPQEALNYL